MRYIFRKVHNLKGLFQNIGATNYLPITSITTKTEMKYLNVAEKNDAAKNIALHLSRGTSRRVSYSEFLPFFGFLP